jgi:5-methylcytosine-specific restriction enzyme subunit McrC
VSTFEIDLTELGPPAERALPLAQGRMLALSGVVTATPSLDRPGYWLVGPNGRVGAARIGDVVIRVRPKVEISRLLFMLGYSIHGASWQADTVDVSTSPDLVAAIAEALWRQVSRAIHQGLLPGYVIVEEGSLVLRGRLLESAQLARHHGLPLPLEIRHDEFTVDIPENQILRTACERMLQVPRVSPQTLVQLRRLLREFSDVASIRRGDPVPAWHANRLNARYHVALRLAELVLRATSAEYEGSHPVAVNGFLLNMPQLFEDFVTVALREAIEPAHGGVVEGQWRGHLDEGNRVDLRPDIVWRKGGVAAAVADAKYKAEKPAGYPNADLYQLLAYCTVLDLKVGHLIYAAGNEHPVHHVARGSGVEIICHALDLSRSPRLLLAQVDDLSRQVAMRAELPGLLFKRAAAGAR